MKLKINKILELHAALSALDGSDEIVEVDGKNVKIKKPYVFSGKVRWNLAKNIRVLKTHVDSFNTVRDDIIKEISGGSGEITETDKEKLKAFSSKIGDVTSQEEEVEGLLTFTPKDLGLEEDKPEAANKIPLAVLSALDILVKE